MEVRVGGKYRLIEKINKGAHSEIWKAENVQDGEYFAVKIEKHKQLPSVHREARIYEMLRNTKGVSKMWWYGFEGNDCILVLDLLGPSIEDMLQEFKAFSLSTVLKIALAMIERIKLLHSRNIVHRDIKPEDMLLKAANSEELIIVDFSLSRSYQDSKNQHIPYAEGKGFVGTARYASINTHLGIQQSRRDDLESLGYSLIYLLKGKLPWQGVKAYTKAEKYNKSTEIKLSTIINVLCDGLPKEFSMYLEYVRSLRFEERPEYEHLKMMFNRLLLGVEGSSTRFEWVLEQPMAENSEEEKIEVRLRKTTVKNFEKFIK